MNTPPTIDAGPDQVITLPASASLNGTAIDDGLPNPPGVLTLTWSQTSGPGVATFADASAENTTVSFSTAGIYVLRLTASDGDLSSFDELTVTVNAVPGVEIIVDNNVTGSSKTGNWSLATSATQHFGTVSEQAAIFGSQDVYTFTPDLPASGNYEVSAWNACSPDRYVAVPHTIAYSGGSTVVYVDQDSDTGICGQWQLLGTFPFVAGTQGYVEISDAAIFSRQPTFIGADAIRFVMIP